VSSGCAPADIVHGAIVSLADRSVQLMKRAGLEPEFTLVGGIARFETMARVLAERLRAPVNVPPGDLAQYTGAIGAALLGHRRLRKLADAGRLDERVEARLAATGTATPY
jgi:(R)-2-hydroxyacyl-CoA dehydratese activating ATPase